MGKNLEDFAMTDDEIKESVRQDGPCPTDYREEDGSIDFDTFEEDFNEWDEESGFSKL